MDIKELIEALTIKEDHINIEAKQDSTWGGIVRRELAKLGLHINPNEKDFTLPVADLIDFADAIYQMGFEDGANSEMKESVNETMERYLSVEPVDEGKAIEVFLYLGDKKSENSFMLDKAYIGNDKAVRKQAKYEFDNITDDIRVQWY
jgi:hypothetical protein